MDRTQNRARVQSIPDESDEIEAVAPEIIHVQPKTGSGSDSPPSSLNSRAHHGVPEFVGSENGQTASEDDNERRRTGFFNALKSKRQEWFTYMKTREFWIVLLLGQILSLGLTGTNTLTTLLAMAGTNIPAFQSLFNYVLLNAIYTSYTIYKYGFKAWLRLLWVDGWRYFLLSFCDVEGNYFVVLAYDYTTILSAELIDFWAIAVVVLISLIFLGVRYHISQYLGILICIGGLGILMGSDHITHANPTQAPDQLKGDLFCLLGATFYGLSNVFEEFFVSKRPLYEVLGQMGWWGMLINGVQAAIFDRSKFQHATWNGKVAGYLVGYNLILFIFYTLAPILFRMSSAAFFNISLLTSDFWGILVGIQVFHLSVYWLYPIAFVCIIVGCFVYFVTEGVLGEAYKPWLGESQEKGVDGVGTAKRKTEKEGARNMHDDDQITDDS